MPDADSPDPFAEGHASLPDDGRMAQRIRSFDWASTSLGPMDGWPRALISVLRTVLASRQPICFWWGPELLQFHNDDYLPILADREARALGAPFRELWSDVWQDVEPFVQAAMQGRGTWNEDLPLDMVRNGRVEPTFWTFSYSPLYGDDGEVAGLLNIVTETTQAVRDRKSLAAEVERASAALALQREAERHQRILQRELSHRMKNTLTMVQAIVTQSLKGAADIEGGVRVASARIEALGRAQDMLTSGNWEATDIGEVVRAAFAPHCDRPERFSVAGPKVSLSPQQAMGLSLAVHELATNAVKYGALASDHGHVEIAWRVSDDADFTFSWTERDGPSVATPAKNGFGSRLTTRVVPYYFDGKAEIVFQPAGIHYVLTGNLGNDGDAPLPSPVQQPGIDGTGRGSPGDRHAIAP